MQLPLGKTPRYGQENRGVGKLEETSPSAFPSVCLGSPRSASCWSPVPGPGLNPSVHTGLALKTACGFCAGFAFALLAVWAPLQRTGTDLCP